MTSLFSQVPKPSRTLMKEKPQPAWVDPTLATLVHQTFSDPDWLFEPKLDGERCLVFKQGDSVRLMSRNGKCLGDTYPELVEAVANQKTDDFIVDGEIVTFEGRKTSFARLQERMQITDPVRARQSSVEVHCYLFDVLHVAGQDVTALPLRDRKVLLQSAIRFRDPLRMTPYRNEEGASYFGRACRAGWEGVLAKDATSGYVHGRSRTWLKFKCVNSQEFVIGGFTEPTGTRSELGALLVGYYEGDQLVYAGKVGTGFTEDALRDLHGQLGPLEQADPPFSDSPSEHGVHWVSPKLVADIEFTEWTGEGKLRHPHFLGLRRDKDPTDVVRERLAV